MLTALLAIGSVALLGHLMFWVNAFNKIHAMALPYRVIKVYEKTVYLVILAVPYYVGWLYLTSNRSEQTLELLFTRHPLVAGYFGICFGMVAIGVPMWLQQRLAKPPRCLVSNMIKIVPVRNEQGELPIGSKSGKLFATIPGNEIFDLYVQEKTLSLPAVSESLDGFSIAHLSDLHFTGDIERSFFDFVVDRTNEMQADLVVITGDIIDKIACLPWIRASLGRLRGKYGVYCILGNHDKRVGNVQRIRDEITSAGLQDLGGRVETIKIGEDLILLAGNEMPWFKPAPELLPAKGAANGRKPFRVLLSHSPDQIDWACKNEFSLVLAGHTHGGQIRLPIIGPIISPSRYGVKYASGLFQKGDTIMHVSRGLSGLDPVRWNCPPELAKIILRPGVA